ncbi:hypothetical protein ABT324_01995 [Saccharopolyspora sp. NPDC000359]|uniref:hypothetical protein n=1 Tax=Saccharopolyspora sp. NPDC000359 TaxID=3154251 RepID=UPI00331E4805
MRNRSKRGGKLGPLSWRRGRRGKRTWSLDLGPWSWTSGGRRRYVRSRWRSHRSTS